MTQYRGQGNGLSAGAVFFAFLTGAVVGAVGALLLAPQSGRESREQLGRYARRTEETLREVADKATETWSEAMEKGREAVERSRDFVREQKSVLAEAFQAGREAMRREQERQDG
jgi:gas vesicle protein